MRIALVMSMLLLPATSMAADQCRHSAPRNLDLELAGIKTVLFEVHSNNLHVDARPGSAGKLQGRACASDAKLLDGLTINQHREGDKLVVSLEDDHPIHLSLGESYSYLDIQADVPDNLLVQLAVGSGDAWATGAAALSADVNSGDIDIRNIKGKVTTKVGSGDIDMHDIGSLEMLALGSGDARIDGVHGPVNIRDIGSGDVELHHVDAAVEVGSVGSGDLDIGDVKGNVKVGHVGSGDLTVRSISGDLLVEHKGSGDIRHSGIAGRTSVPDND